MSDQLSRLASFEDPAVRLAAKARARAHRERLAVGDVPAPFRVGLAGTFTLAPLEPFLVDSLLAAGLEPDVRLAPYGQVFQACLDPGASFDLGADGGALDAIVVLWRLDDLIRPEIDAWLAGDADAPARAESQVEDLARALAGLRQRFDGTIVAAIPPFPEPAVLDLLDGRTPPSLFARLRLRWLVATASIPLLQQLDLDALQRHFGAARARDSRTAYLYRQPYSEGFLALIAERIGSGIASARTPPRKCVALDCDGTLWGGIVGEDGADGVEIGDDYPGSAYRDFQTLLRRWKDRGVLLTLLSKNDEANVWTVFAERPEMRLQRDDLAAWRIDWKRKADNLPLLASALGVGIDAFVFIDDSPTEIAEMQATWPEVRSILVPEDPADLVDTILAQRLFEFAQTTDEDRRRTEMMAAESERQLASARLSPEEFLASLRLTVDVRAATAADIPRVAQLVARTNQFNLTTIRRSAEELRALMASGDWRTLVASAADRFGDHGMIGVAILGRGERPEIDTFLLSCRVLGRGVESAFLAALAGDAAGSSGTRLVARFVRTAKNGAASTFLADHGFRHEQGETWSAAISEIRPSPQHVTVTRS